MALKLKIKDIQRTGENMFSQWEAFFSSGHMLYARFQFGILRIYLSLLPVVNPDDLYSSLNKDTIIYYKEIESKSKNYLPDEQLYIILRELNMLDMNIFKYLFLKIKYFLI